MGLIYCAVFKNGKLYVGQTTQSLKDRIALHKYWAENNLDNFLFHKAIRKYGIDSITWEILENNIEEDNLNAREEFWILQKNSYCAFNRGYNMTLGGDNYSHAYKFSLEECRALFEEYKKVGNASIMAEKYNTYSSIIIRNIKRVAPDWKDYSYDGKGSQYVFSEEESIIIYDYYKLTGSVSRTVEKFNSNTRTIQRVLSRINKNYSDLSWRFKVNKEDALTIYEEFKKTGRIKELAQKYKVSVNSIRNLLIFIDPNYSIYSKRK